MPGEALKRHRRFTLGDLIDWCGGMSNMPQVMRRRKAGNVWHDSRLVKPGDVFVALKTQKDDGHRYIEAAFKAGAAAVIAAKEAQFELPARYGRRVVRVGDPLLAIQNAARRYRRELGILIVGVTGSSGKTTTRSFISAVLRQGGEVGETYTNWNNHIGVALSLLRFNGKEQIGVIEMGANHRGEIAVLSKVAAPDIAVITNIGYAHVGLFGSLSDTTKAKFEIIEGMSPSKGFLLLNGDDRHLVAEARRHELKTVFYGYASRCVIRPQNVGIDPRRGVSFTADGSEFFLGMPGRHFVYSALPAIFLGRHWGISDEKIAAALSTARLPEMRGMLQRKDGVDFIVDCYNANPSSMKSAFVYLDDAAAGGRKVAVVGEMLELGRFSKRLHTELGRAAARSSIDRLIAVGPSAALVINGARKEGMAAGRMEKAESAEDALPIVKKTVRPGDTVLIKGSRGMHLETIFNKFTA